MPSVLSCSWLSVWFGHFLQKDCDFRFSFLTRRLMAVLVWFAFFFFFSFLVPLLLLLSFRNKTVISCPRGLSCSWLFQVWFDCDLKFSFFAFCFGFVSLLLLLLLFLLLMLFYLFVSCSVMLFWILLLLFGFAVVCLFQCLFFWGGEGLLGFGCSFFTTKLWFHDLVVVLIMAVLVRF